MFSDLFHPDNIANVQVDAESSHPVRISTYNLWKKYGGAKGLAQRLKTDVKVTNSPYNLSTERY